MSSPPRLRIQGLRKTFTRRDGSKFHAVDDLAIDVGAGEFLALLGPSGCGKTTLLRCVAGLERPDAGRVELNGQPIFDAPLGLDIPPERRHIGMVFQSYALWPHMTVAQNVRYPLEMRGVGKRQADQSVARILAAMNIAELARAGVRLRSLPRSGNLPRRRRGPAQYRPGARGSRPHERLGPLDHAASSMLAGTGNPVVGFVVLELWSNGSYSALAAFGALMSLLTSSVVLLTLRLTRGAT